ncbi:hypothetical protein PSYPI_48707, partial [Pseudomonas syringae pv. pisi str. 1704B]
PDDFYYGSGHLHQLNLDSQLISDHEAQDLAIRNHP